MRAPRPPRTPRPLFYIIPCGAAKAPEACAARDLYVGSMFTMSLAAAEAEARTMGGTVLILSALHGLLELDTVVAPYDLKMGDTGSVTPGGVAEQAQALGITWENRADVYALLPNAYFRVLDAALSPEGVYAAQVYEACGGIGEQRGVCKIVRDAE